MKWENDPDQFDKELIYDSIIAFSRMISDKNMDEI